MKRVKWDAGLESLSQVLSGTTFTCVEYVRGKKIEKLVLGAVVALIVL